MSLTDEEKFKRKIDNMLNQLSIENNISHQEAKKIYNDYLEAISDIGIDFIDSHFIFYFKLRMTMPKEKAFADFKKFVYSTPGL
jgi:hypothetical protein